MQADFEGFYARFDTNSKNAALLTGADVLVGDEFSYQYKNVNGEILAYLINKFDVEIGYFSTQTTRQLQLYDARGWTVRLLLSFVAYSDHPEPGQYWGQVAVMSYPQESSELFEPFVKKTAEALAEGKRVDVNIGVQGVRNIVDSNGEWFTTATVPMPQFESGTVMMKSRRSFSEKMVEQGRAGNKGCYVVSWAFIIGVIALLAFALHSCGVF